MANGVVWLPPVWDRHGGKHFLPSTADWDVAIARTGQRKSWAKYHPSLDEATIQAMEMSFFRQDGTLNVEAGWHELVSPKPNVREFWREVTGLGHALGASDGQETNYQYVEYNSSGPVHGRPMTWNVLAKKGAVQ